MVSKPSASHCLPILSSPPTCICPRPHPSITPWTRSDHMSTALRMWTEVVDTDFVSAQSYFQQAAMYYVMLNLPTGTSIILYSSLVDSGSPMGCLSAPYPPTSMNLGRPLYCRFIGCPSFGHFWQDLTTSD